VITVAIATKLGSCLSPLYSFHSGTWPGQWTLYSYLDRFTAGFSKNSTIYNIYLIRRI
jgi:hypothetical protein